MVAFTILTHGPACGGESLTRSIEVVVMVAQQMREYGSDSLCHPCVRKEAARWQQLSSPSHEEGGAQW